MKILIFHSIQGEQAIYPKRKYLIHFLIWCLKNANHPGYLAV